MGKRIPRSKQLERSVKALLNAKGIPYMRVGNYVCYRCRAVMNREAKGWPDFVCLKPLLAVECKTGKGRLKKEQKRVKAHLEQAGVEYIVVRDTVDELIEKLEDV